MLTPEVFFLEINPLSFGNTPKGCPHCGMSMWMSMSGFIKVDDKTWSAKSVCFACKKESIWRLDPDVPVEHQKIRLTKLAA